MSQVIIQHGFKLSHHLDGIVAICVELGSELTSPFQSFAFCSVPSISRSCDARFGSADLLLLCTVQRYLNYRLSSVGLFRFNNTFRWTCIQRITYVLICVYEIQRVSLKSSSPIFRMRRLGRPRIWLARGVSVVLPWTFVSLQWL